MLKAALGSTYEIWLILAEFTKKSNPDFTGEWKFASEKYGWSFRISDRKRVILYLLPRDGYFKAAFVFGKKAVARILESDISVAIKDELRSVKEYAEGRGIRIEVLDRTNLEDLKKLIAFKVSG